MLYGGLGSIARVGGNLLLVPIVLQKLSEPELAAWWVFVALGSLANLADFGFGQAIARVYSYLWAGADDFDTQGLRPTPAHAEPNLPRLRAFNLTVRPLYWRLAAGVILLLAVGGTFFLRDSTAAAVAPSRFWLAWGLYALAVGYCLGVTHWSLACQGINRIRELQAVLTWSGVAYVLCAALFLLLDFGLLSMAIAFAVRGWIMQAGCRRQYRLAVPDESGEAQGPDATMIRKLWPNAWRLGLLSLAVYLINHGTLLICSRFLGDATTAAYGLTAQIGIFLVNFSALWLNVKWPYLTILRTHGRTREMAVIFARRLLLTMVTFTLLAVLLVLAGNRFLEWKGTHTRLLATPYLVTYLAYLGQQLFSGQFASLAFTENIVPFFKLGFATGVGLILLSLILTPTVGLWGLILVVMTARD